MQIIERVAVSNLKLKTDDKALAALQEKIDASPPPGVDERLLRALNTRAAGEIGSARRPPPVVALAPTNPREIAASKVLTVVANNEKKVLETRKANLEQAKQQLQDKTTTVETETRTRVLEAQSGVPVVVHVNSM